MPKLVGRHFPLQVNFINLEDVTEGVRVTYRDL